MNDKYWFESVVKCRVDDGNGNPKWATEAYLVKATNHTDVETIVAREMDGVEHFVVRSTIKNYTKVIDNS